MIDATHKESLLKIRSGMLPVVALFLGRIEVRHSLGLRSVLD
ncbi:hypothetical protein [Candidatus Thiosymbion oneisti]|nr:hypothetical protein [Candidatus Thiosymbion oneisti]